MTYRITQLLALLLSLTAMVSAAISEQTVGLFANEPGAFEGYTLFTPRHYNTTYLVDMNGEQVHSWENEARVEHAMLLDNGLLLRAARTEYPGYNLPMVHGLLQMVDWDGSVVWEFRYANDEHILHHDFAPMPNGNILAISYDVISKEDAIAAGRKADTIPAEGLVVDRIIEIKPDLKNGGGEIVWSWSTWDHLIQDTDKTKPNYGKVSDHPERFNPNYFRNPQRTRDWNHVNGIDYNEALDVILVTVHISDEFVVIDHSTTTAEAASTTGGQHAQGGDVLYRFGNPAAYDNGSKQASHYKALHNAHWIPEGLPEAGKIMVLNNNIRGDHSILEVLDLPISSNGSFQSSRDPNPVPVYEEFHTGNMGGGQRLPNGNTLVHESVKGRILEITPDQTVVWNYVVPVANEGPLAKNGDIPANPRSGDLYNEFFLAYRYAPDAPALAGKDLTPQGVIETAGGTSTAAASTEKKPARGGSNKGGRKPITFQLDSLTAAQQSQVDAIIKSYGSQRRSVVQNAGSNRQNIGTEMRKLIQKQNAEIKRVLNSTQYKQYQTWMQQQSNQRGSGRP